MHPEDIIRHNQLKQAKNHSLEKELMEENPESIGIWVKGTDTSNLERIGTSALYLRWMKSRVGLKSIPVDFIFFDELDEATQNAMDMALQSMAHSEVKNG